MSLLAQMRLPVVAAAAGAEPGNLVVVLTGLSLVFLILLILIVVILIQGKVFSALSGRKGEKAPLDKPAAQPTAAAPVLIAAPAPAPLVEAGIPPEVVAAITAAISAATGGAGVPLAVSAVTGGPAVAMPKTRRGSWGLAGVMQTTEPF